MKYNLFDRVRLKDGRRGTIVHILENDEVYLVDCTNEVNIFGRPLPGDNVPFATDEDIVELIKASNYVEE